MGLMIVLSLEIDIQQGGNIIKWFQDGDNPTLQDGGRYKAVGSKPAGQGDNAISFIAPNGGFSNFTPGGVVPAGGSFSVPQHINKLISNVISAYYAIMDETHKNGGNIIKNISDNIEVSTSKGAVYAEGGSLNFPILFH